jgi:AmmeMemoRadiSam system protein A
MRMAHGEEPTLFTERQCSRLLSLARSALKSHFFHQPNSDDPPTDLALLRNMGLFVTLWQPTTASDHPQGLLRGCIGHVETNLPMYQAVAQMAVEAATHDPRFPSLSGFELDNIRIEISVLSPLFQVFDLAQVDIGIHGLMLVGNEHRGLLLPQVPVTRGWSRQQFLQAMYKKAGLPPGIWPKSAQLYGFTTFVFEESFENGVR